MANLSTCAAHVARSGALFGGAFLIANCSVKLEIVSVLEIAHLCVRRGRKLGPASTSSTCIYNAISLCCCLMFSSLLLYRSQTISTKLKLSGADKRPSWAFGKAKAALAAAAERRPPPEFVIPLPIRKTRAGLQFTCAASSLGANQFGFRDVWVSTLMNPMSTHVFVRPVCSSRLYFRCSVGWCSGVQFGRLHRSSE